MINLSGTPLSDAHIKVLSKGLTFAPTNQLNDFDLKVDLFRFYRNLHLKAWYKLASSPAFTPAQTGVDSHRSAPFKPKSYFCPTVQNATLNTFERKVNFEIENLLSKNNTPSRHNLSKEEREALKELSDYKDIVIKRADKGGAVVVWGVEQYTKEAYRQLRDTSFYLPLARNPIVILTSELEELLTTAKNENLITEQEFKFLFNPNPRMPSFYMFPKIHKNLTDPPGRPVISGNDSLTESISKYVDFFIKPLLPSLQAYIQDTTDVLTKIQEHKNIGPNAILAVMDVAALYTSIDHGQGLSALRYYLDKRPHPHEPPTDFLIDLTEWTLNNNVFLFQDKVFKQIKGCAMGACFSPSYAGLYMGKWEEDYVYHPRNVFRDKIIWWGRYIDDVILWWDGMEDELLSFHSYLNSTNSNIQLSLEYDRNKINFLDLSICKDATGNLHTSIYRKDTHKNTILHSSSFHPDTLINNIPLGQFQRLRRICDTDTDFETQSREMYNRFRERNYSPEILDAALSKASVLERKSLLERKPKTNKKDQVYFSTRYSTQSYAIRNIIKRNWDLIRSDETLQRVFPDSPVFSFRRAPTLGDKLVRSHQPATETVTWLPKVPNGTFKCGHCNQCDLVVKSKGFTHPHTLQIYTTRHFINCKTTHVIYILSCSRCDAFYVGRTKRRLQDRLAEHKYAAKVKNMDYAMVKHSIDCHADNSVSFTAIAIDHVPHTSRRGDRERALNQIESRWIHRLQAMQSPGLNDTIDMVSFL